MAPAPSKVVVRYISRSMIKPSPPPTESTINNQHYCHLNPWGLACLPMHYIQYGLLFSAPFTEQLADRLKTSLAAALHRFYLLAGRLQTVREDGGMYVFVDCNKGEGAELIHATASNITAADVANDHDPPTCVRDCFFPLNGAVAYDGRSLPLFAAQVTELADDGCFFLGCSFNHAVGDGTSFVNFLTAWAAICGQTIADQRRRPVHDPWLMEGVSLPIKLPFSDPNDFIVRFSPPPELRERWFRLSSRSVAQLKLRANNECGKNINGEISAFQALCALIWRGLTRARRLPPEQNTGCRIAANNRPRLSPPLRNEYFGSAVGFIYLNTTVGELLSRGLGWAAMLAHESIAAHTDGAIRGAFGAWTKAEAPVMYGPTGFDPHGITIASSPRYDLYGCDFGWGRAAAVRSGAASKYDGKVAMYTGREGMGSVDLEINLVTGAMAALELDEEFMNMVST